MPDIVATREKRKNRIQLDNQDKKETVYTSKWTGKGAKPAYHNNKDCRYLSRTTGEIVEKKRGEAQREKYYPCKICHDIDEPKQYEGTSDSCPFCGEEIGMLPSHLPRCQSRGEF